jgi:heavy metal sensor kinase
MLRSIRWRLQAWHALILLLVVAGFGALLIVQLRASRLQEIDAELHAAARVLEGALRGLPPPILDMWLEDPVSEDNLQIPTTSEPPAEPRFPPIPGRPGPPPRPPRERLERTLALQPRRSPGSDEPKLYSFIWLKDGTLLKASRAAGDVPAFASLPSPEQMRDRFQARQRGKAREVMIMGPRETRVLVGRSIEEELETIQALTWQIALTGLGVLALGLAGGWFLSRRAVRPIEAMSATAAAISATNLSQRIDTQRMDLELGSLAATLNAAFARLEEAFQQQARFTADASHELRTPLAVIHSQLEMALAKPRSAEEYQEAMQACLRAAQRMNNLIQGLLTLAHVDAGKVALQRVPVDLRELVEEAAALVGPLAREQGVALTVSGDTASIEADPERLLQVVVNLLSNAINYNRPSGKVDVAVANEHDEVVLTVVDTGCGIPDADIPHVFERFFRVDKARSRASGGSGLGLAICKSIVEAHGGTIGVTSELDVGTTFVVRLPTGGRGSGQAEQHGSVGAASSL